MENFMKLALIALALLPLTASAIDVSEVELVRMSNGQNILCKQSWELGKPTYEATLANAGVSDSSVNLGLRLQFQICGGTRDDLSLGARRPLDPTYNTDSDGNPVRIEYTQPEFVFGSDLGSQNLQVLPVPNRADQNLSFELPLATGLSAQEKAELAAGRPVRVRTQLLYRALGEAFPSTGDSYKLGYQFGAAYTVFFTLKK
jgi:hypothetical protein